MKRLKTSILQTQAHWHREVTEQSFTQDDLLKRAEQSNNDYLLGNVKTQEELEEESKLW